MNLSLFHTYRHHLFRLGLFASLVFVLYLSTTKIDEPLPGNFSDKFYHGLCFFVLALLADNAYPRTGFTAAIYIPLFAYGVLIECIQYFIPYRSFSLADMVADALGLFVYGMLTVMICRMVRRTSGS